MIADVAGFLAPPGADHSTRRAHESRTKPEVPEGEDRGVERDVALEDLGEGALLGLSWGGEVDRAGDIGCPVEVLGARAAEV